MGWYETSIVKGGEYPFVKIDVDKSRGWVPFIFLSDIHRGAKTYRRQAFNNVINSILEADALVVLGGDLTENANKSSVGAGVYEQVLTPDQQIDAIVKDLDPIKHRIVGAVDGNHEFRTYKDSGVSLTKTYMARLGLADYYLGFEFWGAIGCRKQNASRAYTLYGCHSLSASKNSALELSNMERDWAFIQTDARFKGHGHGLDHQSTLVFRPSASNCGVKQLEQHDFLCGNYVGREDSYPAQKPMKPKPVGSMFAWFKMNGAEKKIRSEELYDGKRAEYPI